MTINPKWIKAAVALLLVVIIAASAFVANRYVKHYTSAFVDVTIDSQVLNESRKLFIRLPHNFDWTQTYPLVIKSDGNFNLKRWDETLTLLSQQYGVEDAIVVAIPNQWLPSLWGKGTRNRDLVPPYARVSVEIGPLPASESKTNEPIPINPGKADKFLEFIETEVIPYVEHYYHVNNDRILSGFSAGGSFVLYAMVTKPELFRGYFAFSPAAWYDDAEVVRQTAKQLENMIGVEGTNKFLYLSLGGDENPIITASFNGLKAALEAHAPINLQWRFEFSPGAGHAQNPFDSIPRAVEAYYQFK